MMMFRLAKQIGCTVAELGDRMSSTEFNEWLAYYQLEPFGYEIENWRAGMIGSTIANVNRPPKHKPFTIEDFSPKRVRKQTPDQMLANLMGWFSALKKKAT